ncbi:chaplin family protein, partial [Streptomyces sp. SP17BM10]
MPITLCGNSINVIGLLNPAFGNSYHTSVDLRARRSRNTSGGGGG